MSLEEEDKKKVNTSIIEVLCRGKVVYVPFYIATKYSFFKSYLSGDWNKEKPLEINEFPPEMLQAEIDSNLSEDCVSDFLGFEGNKKKTLYLEDLLVIKNGVISCSIPIKNIEVSDRKGDSIETGYTVVLKINNYIRIMELCLNSEKKIVIDIKNIMNNERLFRSIEKINSETSICDCLDKFRSDPQFLACFFPTRNR